MGRILYECLDLHVPAGGVRRIYRHVEILQRHGFSAAVLQHTPGFSPPWFASNAPIEYWTKSFRFDRDDILVIPEGHVEVMRKTADAAFRRVIICLNWSRIFLSLAQGETWKAFGISGIISGSNYEREFILRSMGLDSTVIASGIDSELFVPAAVKKCAVAFMPRKDPIAGKVISCIFATRFPEYHTVPFIAIEGISHVEVARILGSSAVFLAQTVREGLSRKTLEAMSCGCLVVGFAGQGTRECMNAGQNCYLAPDGDLLSAAEMLGQAVGAFRAGGSIAMQTAAIKMAHFYSLQREEENVVKFWSEFTGNAR